VVFQVASIAESQYPQVLIDKAKEKSSQRQSSNKQWVENVNITISFY
jgi:hypothetical protein